MPFHGHFQAQSALLVESSNFVSKNTGYTASPGDVVLGNTGTSGVSAAFTVTLPPVAQCGPVTVVNVSPITAGSGATITIVTSDSSTIDGITGATGTTLQSGYTRNTFSSNGTSWFRVA